MEFIPTRIPDVIEIQPKVHGDERGFFLETYRQDVFARHGIACEFVQDNHSKSHQHILRGLHYQVEQAQGKLVRVTSGRVFDVAVDLRRSSPTFGQWVGVELCSGKKNMLWVPPGFAHGFYVITQSAEFVYKCTDFYAPEFERSLLWNDPALQIAWPLPSGITPVLSAKDQNGQLFKEAAYYP